MYYYGERYYDPRTSIWLGTDPLQEKYPNISSYAYCALNPVKFVDPNGMLYDDYHDNTNGKYLGSDNASTQDQRLISKEMYQSITAEQSTPSLTGLGGRLPEGWADTDPTAELQAHSTKITIDNAKIQSDIQSIADLSFGDNKVEQQAYIVLNLKTAEITSIIGSSASATNGTTSIESFPAPATGVSFITRPGGPILIGQIHTHPKTMLENHITEKTMSPNVDKPTAISLQIPIYGIDAMDNNSAGSSVNIHRVTPDGTITNNVGKTSNNFNIGRQSLNYWGRSGKPTN